MVKRDRPRDGLPSSSDYFGYKILSCGQVIGRNGQMLKPFESKSRSGKTYLRVKLYLRGYRRAFLVHRLVAHAYLGDIKGMEVNHLDRNPHNNDVNNLEILTAKENQRHWRKTAFQGKQRG